MMLLRTSLPPGRLPVEQGSVLQAVYRQVGGLVRVLGCQLFVDIHTMTGLVPGIHVAIGKMVVVREYFIGCFSLVLYTSFKAQEYQLPQYNVTACRSLPILFLRRVRHRLSDLKTRPSRQAYESYHERWV